MNGMSFSRFIQADRRGALEVEATEALNQLIESVKATGAKGEIVLKIGVSLYRRRDGDAVELTAEVKVKDPRVAPEKSIYFIAEDGGLVQDDPRQPRIPFPRAVEPTRAADPSDGAGPAPEPQGAQG